MKSFDTRSNSPWLRLMLLACGLLLLAGCRSEEAHNELANVEDSFYTVTSYRMSPKGPPGGFKMTHSYLLEEGEILAHKISFSRSKYQITDYIEGYMYKVEGKTAVKIDISDENNEQANLGFSGIGLFENDSLEFTGFKNVNRDDCACFEATTDGSKVEYIFGKNDGILRVMFAEDNPMFGMMATITSVNSVPESEFKLPSNITMRDMSEKEKAMMEMVRQAIKKARENQ